MTEQAVARNRPLLAAFIRKNSLLNSLINSLFHGQQ